MDDFNHYFDACAQLTAKNAVLQGEITQLRSAYLNIADAVTRETYGAEDVVNRIRHIRQQKDEFATLLRYAIPFIQHCNDCGAYRDSDAEPLVKRIIVAISDSA